MVCSFTKLGAACALLAAKLCGTYVARCSPYVLAPSVRDGIPRHCMPDGAAALRRYVDPEGLVSNKGQVAAHIQSADELVLTELIFSGGFQVTPCCLTAHQATNGCQRGTACSLAGMALQLIGDLSRQRLTCCAHPAWPCDCKRWRQACHSRAQPHRPLLAVRTSLVPRHALKLRLSGAQGKAPAVIVAMLSCFLWQESSEKPPALPIALNNAHK